MIVIMMSKKMWLLKSYCQLLLQSGLNSLIDIIDIGVILVI